MSRPTPSIDEIFFAAMEHQSPEARAPYLDEVCGSDPGLSSISPEGATGLSPGRQPRVHDATMDSSSFAPMPRPLRVSEPCTTAEGHGNSAP